MALLGRRALNSGRRALGKVGDEGKMDKGKLIGSPERLNLFTIEGEVVRLDLEIEAHLGSTLHAGDLLVLEKGNRLDDGRLQQIRAVHRR